MSKALTHAATLVRRNGAYLISAPHPDADVGPDEEYDAASSLRVAKKLARSMAEMWGFAGPWRWVSARAGMWELYGNAPEEDGDEWADLDLEAPA